MGLIHATQVLRKAGLHFAPYSKWRTPGVFVTNANQLVGTHAKLRQGALWDPNYRGWEAHHVVEVGDLKRLGISNRFPPKSRQLCVLLPNAAHSKRINGILRSKNPPRDLPRVCDLMEAYREAYSLMDDYCGGGATWVRRELVRIVSATFKLAGLRWSEFSRKTTCT